MPIKKINLAPLDESKPDTIFHNGLLREIVLYTTVPCFFLFNIFVDQDGRNDIFMRHILLSMVLSMSIFIPFASSLRERKLLFTIEASTDYRWKFIYSLTSALLSVLIYSTCAPETNLGVLIYDWIWLPIVIPYCVTSTVLYGVLYLKLVINKG